ncbi:ABC transporter ATP-binding protein [Leucobacter weissii]|uniref:ABC transporter ATP-binding protein n=1 Tax=Leucobacter weissii TaxID=1983706 RepID=A0A939MJ82_9MICO|nr:ABC transporter ATP-binding protein [Leucobacter weissii]MBO1901250.1 ABC transporter ATP-binding protein [Leucobacter weissii]
MTEPTPSDPQPSVTPTRRDRLRPLELVGFAGVLAVFAGLVVLLTTRDLALAGIFAGIGFIVVLLTVALVGLGGSPSEEDVEARKDLRKPDAGNWH